MDKVVIPEGWLHEEIRSYGIVLTAVDAGQPQGYVTIDLQKRAFILGIAPVR